MKMIVMYMMFMWFDIYFGIQGLNRYSEGKRAIDLTLSAIWFVLAVVQLLKITKLIWSV
ncbi:MAG: hypothetical protein ACRCX2_07870 [Paraclostridium sp.]